MHPLGPEDKLILSRASPDFVVNVLAVFRNEPTPPWLRLNHPFANGNIPRRAIETALPSDLREVVSIRGPLHAVDGWAYLGKALNALMTGSTHTARHLAYYAELRAALSILASSGIGIFNNCNFVIDINGHIETLTDRGTHDMCWAAINHWVSQPNSLERMIKNIGVGGVSLLNPLRTFFPGSSSAAAANYLMQEWGFDLKQGVDDRNERNWSSYQPTELAPILTSPADDIEFFQVFWQAMRPNGDILERHLLRILLEVEERSVGGLQIADIGDRYDFIDDQVRSAVSFNFLTREVDPYDHKFLIHAADKAVPAHPYSMICRAALLLKVASGMAGGNLIAAGLQPAFHFGEWWRRFGVQHGLWPPQYIPDTSEELWEDVSVALADAIDAASDHRHGWTNALGSGALRICESPTQNSMRDSNTLRGVG